MCSPTTLLLTLLLFTTAMQAGVTPLPSLSEPALSPDRSEIAFIAGGDIWTVSAKGGEAHLLVSHPATEMRPLYSPDGTKLAFTSTRTGNGDIYVLTFATGDVKRLTYSDVNDLLDGWSHDGKWLYFSSSVNEINQAQDIFRVSVNGGTPLEVVHDRFYNEFRGAPSPDGAHLAFVTKGISSSQWWRHGHSHLDESEIWLKGIADESQYQCLVKEDAKQGWPMWSADGKDLFYTSDRTGVENVFRQSVAGGPAKQISHLSDGRLLWPSISYDGREIVFERGFKIWKLDTKSGAASEIPVTLRGAASTPAVTHQTLTQFTDMALSKDGKKIAVVAHGEVFAASANENGDALRITRTAAPERDVEWAPDSNRLIYTSPRNGHYQIFEYDLVQNTERQLTATEYDDTAPHFSPNGRSLAFVRNGRELYVLTFASKKETLLASGDLRMPALTWSPDNRFLAFTSIGAKSFRNVNIVESSGGVVHPVSFLANGQTANRIAWSPDGKYLLFNTAQRSEPSQMARVDLQPHVPRFREDQFRELFRSREPSPDQRPSTQPSDRLPTKPGEADTPARNENAPLPAEIEKAPSKPATTIIAFEGIRERLNFVPLGLDAGEPIISPDGKVLVFAATLGNQRNLYAYSLDELAVEPPVARQLTTTSTPKSNYQFSADSKTLFFLDNGRVASLPLETRIPKVMAVTASLDIDFDADKMAAFEQAWATLNKQFYDPKFRGQNWKQLHDLYAPYIAGSHTPDEMRRLINLMIGELNASHSGINPAIGPQAQPSAFSPVPAPIGRLGLRFERKTYEDGKGLLIREIIPLSPAALDQSLKVGETLWKVDGEEVGPQTNLDDLLQSKVNRRVVLQVKDNKAGSARDVTIRPVSTITERGLLYRGWVEANRAYVERISHGKLGYVHIADMSQQSLNQLYIDLDVQNQTKNGVVIDIRDNNGGFVNQYAIDVFTRKNYLTMTPRDGSAAPARPSLGQRALGLPTILVTNQGSLSDAEDFTEGYRTLKLGKVVGEPTAGWIIYTGAAPLLDGSTVRVPFTRVQAADGTDMEMHPRPVDIRVERTAGDWLQGKDAQLDRAVKELLGQTADQQ